MRKLELSLHRIARLHLFKYGQHFKAVHVAGTNGKGSICTYLSRFLGFKGVKWGRYTSPYLTHPSDSVVVNGQPMRLVSWNQQYKLVLKSFRQNTLKKLVTEAGMEKELAALEEDPEPNQHRLDLLRDGLKRFGGADQYEQLSEFELETAIALNRFNLSRRVDVGIVEAGMGGTADATNIIPEKLVTVLSRIGLDHTEYLGSTVEAIAGNKAGIMSRGAPCVIDGHSPRAVIETLVMHARRVGAPFYVTTHKSSLPSVVRRDLLALERQCLSLGFRDYEKDNAWCAYLAGRLVLHKLGISDLEEPWKNERSGKLMNIMLQGGKPAGRLQFVPLPPRYNRVKPILVDGAHNALGAQALGDTIAELRTPNPITWILAFSDSQSKDPADLLAKLPIQPQDHIAAIRFRSPVLKRKSPTEMSWEEFLASCDPETRIADAAPEPVDPQRIIDALVSGIGFIKSQDNTWTGPPQMSSELLEWAVKLSNGDPVVVTGSLYMIRDLFRLLRKEEGWALDDKALLT